MIQARNIRVRSFDLDRLDVWWEIDSTSEDPEDYDTYVLRSDSPLGDYTVLTPDPLVDTYHFRDIQVNLLHAWRKLYYRIRMVHRVTGDVEEFPHNTGASVDPPLALDAMEAARHEEVLLREHIGRPCWLFKRRTFGPRCPHCYDARMGRRKTKRCEACFGSGWMRGYHRPIQFWCQIDPETESSQNASTGEQQQELSRGRCTFFPPINPRDVIVELENLRWRVETNTPTRRLRSPIHQEFTLWEIPAGSIEYALPMDALDLESFADDIGRDFVNPQNMQSSTGQTLSMEELKSIYGWRL